MQKYRINIKTGQKVNDNGQLGVSFYNEDWKEATSSESSKLKLQEAKEAKIKSLKDFHESDDVRILTINDNFKISTNFELTRKWFNEIIDDLKNESYVTGKSYEEIIFEWEISVGVWLPVNLKQLCNFKQVVFNITKTNFKQYRTHIKAIESLKNITDVDKYDFANGYLINNKLNFDL